MDFFRKTVRWIRAHGPWLMQARRVWVPVVVALAIVLVTSLLPTTAEDRVRYCGLILQLLGIGTVVFGIMSKRRLFRRPSLLENVRHWLSRRPRWGVTQHTILSPATGSLSLSGTARLSVWRGVGPTASLEDRVAAAEANLITLRSELSELTDQLQAEAGKRVEAVNAERQARETAVRDLRAHLEGLGAEGLHMEMTGVFWLVMGVVLATIPGEIACTAAWLIGR